MGSEGKAADETLARREDAVCRCRGCVIRTTHDSSLTICSETLQLELTATNPLNAPLVLSDLTVTADRPDAVSITMIPEVTLDPYETRTIEIAITNLIATTFTVTDVSFMYHRFLPCRQSLRRRGKRLHVSKTERLTPTFAADTTLTVDIGDARPQLRAELRDLPMVLYAGEEVDAVLRLTNVGKLAVDDVQLLTNGMGMIRLRDSISEFPACSFEQTR